MRQKLNLKDKGQISRPNENTDNFKSNLTFIFLSDRAKFKKKNTLPSDTVYQPKNIRKNIGTIGSSLKLELK